MKIWFFVEGPSESFLSLNFMRKIENFSIHHKSIINFINVPDDPTAVHYYIYDCKSVDAIPHRINDNSLKILQSKSENIFIVCDVENSMKCFSNRYSAIINRLHANLNSLNFFTIFTKLYIEKIYWDHPDIIKRLMEIEYKEIFPNKKIPDFKLPITGKNKKHLKELYSKYELKYNTIEFSKQFFSRLQIGISNNSTVQRFFDQYEKFHN